jgi:hypothetical protein
VFNLVSTQVVGGQLGTDNKCFSTYDGAFAALACP